MRWRRSCAWLKKTWNHEPRKKMPKVSPMSEEFHDWLDQCPVNWIRDRVEKDHVFYAFATPDEDEEE
jgi:hypothetical protein